MSLTGTFTGESTASSSHEPARRPAPFSLRLNADERARLAKESGGAPLGGFIKARLFGEDAPPVRTRRSGLPVEDRRALAQALALLGRARLSSNLNQLAHAANIGVLPLTPETEAELREALADIREIRRLLMSALGLKAEERQ